MQSGVGRGIQAEQGNQAEKGNQAEQGDQAEQGNQVELGNQLAEPHSPASVEKQVEVGLAVQYKLVAVLKIRENLPQVLCPYQQLLDGLVTLFKRHWFWSKRDLKNSVKIDENFMRTSYFNG